MFAPLRRHSGRKRSQVRKSSHLVSSQLWTRKIVIVANFKKHREIKNSDKYVTLDISLKFDSLDNMKITSSESKDNLWGSEKGFITSMGLKSKVRPKKWKKARYTIGNISKKDLSKIIREFEKLTFEIYERKRPKHEHNDSYFYLSRQLAKFMMRDYSLNLHGYPARTEMNDVK